MRRDRTCKGGKWLGYAFHTFLLGTAVMVNELTTALPYFVAIERIAMSYGARFAAQTERISAAIARWAPRVFKYGSLALGTFFVIDAAAFFVRGDALFT